MIRRLSVALCLLLAASPAAAQTRFLAAFDDVPLAPALAERPADAFAFATPEGRIADAVATGPVEEGAVRAYYRAALPPLGWSEEPETAAAMAFIRGRDRLTLSFARGSDGGLAVRYRIVSRPASLALD